MATALSSAPALAATSGSPRKTGTVTSAKSAADLLTQDQALKQAHKTGKAVAVPGDESATGSLTANPDGTLTLTTYAQPVRKLVDGSWHALDATLRKNADGTVSPTLSASPLTLSGGGTGALVTMHSGDYSLGLSLPVSLPKPTLSGDTATYPNVVSGVDLVVTVDDQGGFSDSYVVHSAAAAADPELADLLSISATAKGLHLSVDAASGVMHAADSRGRDVFTAPAASMWDSATDAALPNTPKAAATKAATAAGTGSNAYTPGSRAHQARLGEHLSGNTLSLSMDKTLLGSASLQYPLYVDPPWSAYSNGQWATVSENYPTQGYWNTSAESGGLMQVGQSPTGFWADSLVNFNIPTGEIYNGGTPKFESATLYATNYSTDNHSTSVTDIYAPSATLNSSNATWNNWFTSSRSLGSAIGSASFAQDTTKSIGFGLSTSWISASKSTQTFALAGDSYSDESTNTALYKVFYNPKTTSGTAAPSLSLTFSHAPTVFDLSTSPNKTTIGDGSVALNADVSDVDGGTLTVAFDAYITGHTSEVIKSGSLSAGSGTSATMWIYQPTLDTDLTSSAFGNTSTTTSMSISWQVTVSNGNAQSTSSSVKTFTYSTASPGAPNIWVDSAHTMGCPNTDGSTFTVGTPATFYLSPEANDTTVPTTYTYQLNGGQPETATTDSSGDATITVTPTSQMNVLTVDAIASSGNIGQPQLCDIPAGGVPNAAPGDMSGGESPDLLITGTGTSALPSGLWLAQGDANGQVQTNSVNIGIDGTGQSTTNTSATTYNGTQSISGLFYGSGFNDVLTYNPTTGASNEACSGVVTEALGTDQALNPDWNTDVTSNDFTLYAGTPSYECATSVANGGNLYLGEANSGNAPVTSVNPADYGDAAFPDLLMLAGGSLWLEPNTFTPGGYVGLGSAIDLSDTNPTGTGTWAGWTITTLNTGGDIPYLYAVNQSTGAVYYYSTAALGGLVWDAVMGGSAGDTPVELATSGYGSSTYPQITATSVNGAPALWGVASSGAVSTVVLNTGGTGLSASGSAATVSTTAHAWALNDDATTATDAGASPLTMTGSGSVVANTGDLFSPDVDFTTGVNGTMKTTSAGLDLTKSFTVSIWADPEEYGMQALSQDGTEYPGLMLYPTPTGWEFYLADDNGGGTGWDGDDVIGGSVQLGAWSHLQATFDATNKVMTLYVDDTLVATGSHTAPATGATGSLRLGANIDNGTITSYFVGQLAQLQTWSGKVLEPAQPYTAASYHQSVVPERILDTRASGTNAYSGAPETDTPLGAYSTETVRIDGDTVVPIDGGKLTAIPSTATAVAIDVTLVSQTSNGNLTAYADGTQRPLTSSTNYVPTTTVTGYQIVPIGSDGKIALYNYSAGTTQVIIDLTGYFTSNATLAGDQTYHPLASAYRAVNTGSSTANTNLPSGTTTVPAGTAFTMNITGVDGIPSNATAVAVNVTASAESGGGYVEVYPTGSAPAADTALSFQTNNVASMSADVPLGTGGTITIQPQGGNTRIIGDISGYYTNDTTGDAYHSVNPTRLVDTRIGIGGSTGVIATNATYTISGADTQQLTTATTPVLALMLTATQTNSSGDALAYPSGATAPGTSNLNWNTGQVMANLALAQTSSAGAVAVQTQDTNGTTQLVVDCSGYFANDAQSAPSDEWPLNDGTGASAADVVGASPLSLTGSYTWAQNPVNSPAGINVLNLDGSTAYGQTSGPVLNTAGSFSVSAWANLSSLANSYATVVAQSGSQAAGFYLQYNAPLTGWCLNFMTSDTASAPGLPSVPCSSTAPTVGTWYHLVGTYDAASHTAALYVNGTLASSVSGVTTWAAGGPLTVGEGQYDAAVGNYFPGDISDVQAYNYALNAAQVSQLYQETD